MAEIRIDPLTGLRAIAGEPPPLAPDSPEPAQHDKPELFTALAARGHHEVIVTEPQSQPPAPASLAGLQVEQVIAVVDVWRERMRTHEGAAYVHLSVDEPPEDGAPHCAQLHALDFVPAAVARERERFSAYAVRTMGGNLLEDVVADEVRRRERIVAIDGEAVLMCPYASSRPFQLMLAPRRRRERFEDDGPTGAALLHKGLTLLREHFGESPPLSLWIRTAPRGADRFCWRIDIVPRLTQATGLELGTGLAHNLVTPEHAAAKLRALL